MAHFIPANHSLPQGIQWSISNSNDKQASGERVKRKRRQEREKKDVLEMSKCEHNFTPVSLAKPESSVG
jgi:hypothetical protein